MKFYNQKDLMLVFGLMVICYFSLRYLMTRKLLEGQPNNSEDSACELTATREGPDTGRRISSNDCVLGKDNILRCTSIPDPSPESCDKKKNFICNNGFWAAEGGGGDFICRRYPTAEEVAASGDLPGGTWHYTARNINIADRTAELLKDDGSWVHIEVPSGDEHPDRTYENIDGALVWTNQVESEGHALSTTQSEMLSQRLSRLDSEGS